MVSFKNLAIILSVATGLAEARDPSIIRDVENQLEARQNGEFITQYWATENAELDWESGPAGNFRVEWDQGAGGNFVVGKGYSPSREMLVNYTGTFQTRGNAYLALYGWTLEPLVEWYVIESFGSHNPSDNANSTCYGTFQSDGGTYEVWMKWRVNAPSIIGTATFPQFWSVRTKKHVGGTINTARHFEAYANAGLILGDHEYMVVGIEGQTGRGSSNITVGVPPATRVPQRTTATTRTEVPMGTNTCQGSL